MLKQWSHVKSAQTKVNEHLILFGLSLVVFRVYGLDMRAELYRLEAMRHRHAERNELNEVFSVDKVAIIN